jgi:hypothetical protein
VTRDPGSMLSSLGAIMPKVAFRITLSDEERATLEGIVSSGQERAADPAANREAARSQVPVRRGCGVAIDPPDSQ